MADSSITALETAGEFVARISRQRLLRQTLGAVALVILVVLPQLLSSYSVYEMALAGVGIVAAVGMYVTYGLADEAFLGGAAVAAISSYATALIVLHTGLGYGLAVLFSVLLAMAVAVIVALPALRLSGWILAVVSLGLAASVSELADQLKLTGGALGLQGLPVPQLGSVQLIGNPLYYLILCVLIIVVWVAYHVRHSAWGIAMAGLTSNAIATRAAGVSIYRTKTVAFVIGSAFFGLAGSLYAVVQGGVNSSQFSVTFSIYLFLAVVIGLRTLAGTMIGSALLFGFPVAFASIGNWQTVIFGALLMAVPGLRAFVRAHSRSESVEAAVGPSFSVAEISPRLAKLNMSSHIARAEGGLVAKQITRYFGAVHAVDGVDIEIAPGSVVGVVGPNGSGKTTLINILSGYERSDKGAVWLNGTELKTTSAVARAALGVGRTFQVPQLVENLTLAENVMLGARGHPLATGVARALGLPLSGRAWHRLEQQAIAALDLVGLQDLASLQAGRVSHGIRRRCEIAKVIISRPTVVLLDEPGAGLSDVEMENLAAIVRSVADGGAAVLLVDHNVPFLSRVSDYMILMNLGQKVFEGDPKAVLENNLTANVYFGSGQPS